MRGLFRCGSGSRRYVPCSSGSRHRGAAWSLVWIVLLLNLVACSSRPNVFSEPRDSRLRRYDQEQARLARTADPVNRTNIQIRISDLLISFMGDAVSSGDVEVLESRVEEYRATIGDAHETLLNSGRDPARRPAGFRELEIALRQHVRQLADIGSQLTVENRQPIERLIGEVAGMRDQLMEALFPGRNAAEI